MAVHRISGPRGTKSGNANPRRKSVLLMHGILMSSTMFLALGPEYSLGYILADAGYDVWLDIEFRKFDFGEAENRRRYGHVTPPAYNVSRIPCPVALFWAENDPTTKTKVSHLGLDVRRLEETVPNFKRSYRVNSESFDHADFIFSKKAKTLVYQDIVELLKQY
ncbi:hypothetical protein HAZT_HAZT009252 [Hyalella azteca]|uniref:Uncharacterized protein n=1 Tax=Hyalella azteca TaxID=294128 RepID=A0A6A0GQM1_HYAAZ|nr:hypothetical protein HAZT_HAZT009252 [Hyalella azteca]